MNDWSHARINEPRLALLYGFLDEISDVAAAALQRRIDGYPYLVSQGRMSQAEAGTDIEAWQAIVRDWRWIAGGTGKPADIGTRYQRRHALDISIDRYFARLDRNGDAPSEEAEFQIAALAAMRSEVEREFTGPLHRTMRSLAAIGHRWRAENGYRPLEIMQQGAQEKAA